MNNTIVLLKNKRLLKLALTIGAIFLFFPLVSFAEGPSVTGYVKTSLYSNIYNYDIPSDYVYGLLNFDGTVGNHAAYHIGLNAIAGTEGVSSSSRESTEFGIKEAYIDASTDLLDIRVGKQIVSWGLADGINPTDNINPRYIGNTRYTSELDEQKIGVIAARTDIYPTAFSQIELLLIPVFTPNVLPTMDFTTTDGQVTIESTSEAELPEHSWKNIEGGLRTLFYFSNFSFSTSYLYIYDRYPDIGTSTTGIPPALTITLFPIYNRVHVFGMDFQTSFLGLDIRGEGVFFISQEDYNGTDPAIKNSMFKGVLQFMKGFFSDKLNVKLSWIPQYVFNFKSINDYTGTDAMIAEEAYKYNGQAYEVENGLSLYINGSFLYETLNPEAMFLYNISARDFLFTAKLGYDLQESMTVSLGCNLYGSVLPKGDPDREYGLFGKASMIDESNIYLELRLAF